MIEMFSFFDSEAADNAMEDNREKFNGEFYKQPIDAEAQRAGRTKRQILNDMWDDFIRNGGGEGFASMGAPAWGYDRSEWKKRKQEKEPKMIPAHLVIKQFAYDSPYNKSWIVAFPKAKVVKAIFEEVNN